MKKSRSKLHLSKETLIRLDFVKGGDATLPSIQTTNGNGSDQVCSAYCDSGQYGPQCYSAPPNCNLDQQQV